MYWFTDGTDQWVQQLPERDHLSMLFSINSYITKLPYMNQVRERISSDQIQAFDSLSQKMQFKLLKDPIVSDACTTSGQARIIQHMQLIACFQDWLEIYQEFYRLDDDQILLRNFKNAQDHWFALQTFDDLCDHMSEAGFDTKWVLLDSKHHWRPNEVIEQDIHRIFETLQNHPTGVPNVHPNVLFFQEEPK